MAKFLLSSSAPLAENFLPPGYTANREDYTRRLFEATDRARTAPRVAREQLVFAGQTDGHIYASYSGPVDRNDPKDRVAECMAELTAARLSAKWSRPGGSLNGFQPVPLWGGGWGVISGASLPPQYDHPLATCPALPPR